MYAYHLRVKVLDSDGASASGSGGPNQAVASNAPATFGTREVSLKKSIAKAILTDGHFWIPVSALVFGVLLLIYVH